MHSLSLYIYIYNKRLAAYRLSLYIKRLAAHGYDSTYRGTQKNTYNIEGRS